MANAGSGATKRQRQSKACGRCRKRKIRCDFQYPTCGACVAAGATCLGFDTIEGANKPRSVVHHLEEHVARLEAELAALKSQTENTHDRAIDAIETLSVRLATAIAEPTGLAGRPERLPSLVAKFFLSDSPMPPFFDYDQDDSAHSESQSQPGRVINISSIPRHVVEAMLHHYCKTYRSQYPSIDEADLYSARDRLYANTDLFGYDAFIVYITLAISSNTLAHNDEKRAAATTHSLWITAVTHLEQLSSTSSWERLQALQLLTHYGFLNPQHVNVGHCAAAASRLALHLGLHEELPFSDQVKLGSDVLNTRRRMFWNAYGIDAATHSVRCQPFKWSRPEITAKLPDTESRATPTHSAHMWSLREIECDITMGLYYPLLDDTRPDIASDFDDWRASMQKRLEIWHQTVRQSVSLSEKIEFHELLFQIQLLRLHRPSPRCAHPSKDMRKTALKASIALIREYSVLDRLGKMFMLWHASFCAVESGVYLLSSVLKGFESTNPDRQHMCGEDASILAKYIRTFSNLINKISRRWSSISPYTSALTTIATSVLSFLQRWSTGQNILSSEYNAFKEKLEKMGTLSATASPTQAVSNIQTQSELDPSPATSSQLQGYTYTVFNSAGFEAASKEAASFIDHGLIEGQSSLDPNFSIFPESYAIDYDPMTWDFSGVDSEEIFAAMLEGEPSHLAASTIYSPQL